ncbi:MAG: MerC domain-containing protein [Leptolyngbyaceae cyanobacterium T60_A2020_046]|nr:MerC domain-containing protein [Leptolyngbyaceae cyanobacterium T60_A2020_046]
MSIPSKSGFWQRHADKVGIGGSIFAALCCLGFPALLSLLAAIGLSFLINDAILLPLLAIFLVITLGGLYAGMRHHRQPWAFGLGLLSALVLFAFLFINTAIAYAGLVGLIVAGGLNIYLARQRKNRRT